MVLDLATLISAVGMINSLLKESLPLIQTIRSGMLARNDEAKQQLATKLNQLQQNIQHAGELARVAEEYSRTLENVLELLWLCRRAERFLNDNLDDCRKRNSGNYAGNWKVLEAIFETINSNSDTLRKVVMDRAKWYDEKDKAQIELLYGKFQSAYDRASTDVRNKVADELLYELRSMTGLLQEVETLLRDTVYDKILRTLQKLGS